MNRSKHKLIDDPRISQEERVKASKNRAILKLLVELRPYTNTLGTMRTKVLYGELNQGEIDLIKTYKS